MLANCDVTLPEGERYASPKFRRLSRRFYAAMLTPDEQLELAAFLKVVPVRWSRFIFQWDRTGIWQTSKLPEPPPAYVDAVRASVDVEDGVRVLQAMLAGGWKQGQLPWICRMAVLALRDKKLSFSEISEITGLSYWQVQGVVYGPKKQKRGHGRRSRAAAAVLVG
jgi:hypothetical protein